MTAFRGVARRWSPPSRRRARWTSRRSRGLVEWQIESGIDFLVPCGSTGEAQTLRPRNGSGSSLLVVETATGRVPVMAGASHNDTRQAVEEARRMSALGVDWLLVATPYYNKPTPEGLFRHFSAVADAATVPICLYNIPGRTAVNLKPETAAAPGPAPERSRHQGIERRPGPGAASARRAARWLRGPVGRGLDDPGDHGGGGDGLISVASNEIPGTCGRWSTWSAQGNLEEARQLLYRVLPLLEANFLETNPAPVKAALAAMGESRMCCASPWCLSRNPVGVRCSWPSKPPE